jgi:cytochrome P450 family 6
MGLLMSDNYWVDTIVLMVTVLFLIYWYATSTFDYWTKQGVREVKTKDPFFGAVRKSLFLQEQLSLHYHDMYKELEGEKYGGLFNMRTPAVMVRDPDLLKYIMIKDFSSFTDNTSHFNGDNDPMLGKYKI